MNWEYQDILGDMKTWFSSKMFFLFHIFFILSVSNIKFGKDILVQKIIDKDLLQLKNQVSEY